MLNFNHPKQKQVLLIALPMIASNLTIPLLSLVDTAVVGHLEHAWYLGGVALGSSLISLLFLLLGFLRMSTTGLTAQAFGAGDKSAQRDALLQAALVAIGLALLLLLLHPLVMPLVQLISQASNEVLQQAGIYFQIRVWSAPAALLNMVLLGWFLGLHNARYPMWLLLINQSLNIVLDLLFVLGFGWKVAGVAAASVIADYTTLLVGLLLVRRLWQQHQLAPLVFERLSRLVGYGRLFALNRDIFIRSLCLQGVFVFIAFRGASYGDAIVAANAVLITFLMLVSYALDGFAYAAEACTGKAVGAKDSSELQQLFAILAGWGLVLGIIFSLLFWLGGTALIGLLTSIVAVQQNAAHFLPWLIALPLIAVWSYLLDGIYIGATKARAMRNSMLLSFAGFGLCYLLLQGMDNHALWLALSVFMLLRGLTLGWPLYRFGSDYLLKN
ncbi:MATE family efflux transporter DinF [Alkalimonas amylolytica]|uniref:Multidrug resistance protein, MATE family n=1 Tax=Alkalimonas amylolytica TaxID=152573 RepID=A0A1H4BJY2_ALKAM|nr:MATE family efflux transporter DinF [Alkalimonas amylolytica]SEA48473.1 multidrug resistance protein, MATE family [Alkalimonas amylolytica]